MMSSLSSECVQDHVWDSSASCGKSKLLSGPPKWQIRARPPGRKGIQWSQKLAKVQRASARMTEENSLSNTMRSESFNLKVNAVRSQEVHFGMSYTCPK